MTILTSCASLWWVPSLMGRLPAAGGVPGYQAMQHLWLWAWCCPGLLQYAPLLAVAAPPAWLR